MHAPLGIIGSSAGSTLAAAAQCLAMAGHEFRPVIVTDRPCGIESWAASQDLPASRIAYSSAEAFSLEAEAVFAAGQCADVLLFYTRRVTSPLIEARRVWNIHPSLLPAYSGLSAVERAHASRSLLLGASLHRVDKGLDTGPLQAQVAASPPPVASLASWQRISFIQRVWLTLHWFERVAMTASSQPSCYGAAAPVALATASLTDIRLLAAFDSWCSRLAKVDA